MDGSPSFGKGVIVAFFHLSGIFSELNDKCRGNRNCSIKQISASFRSLAVKGSMAEDFDVSISE